MRLLLDSCVSGRINPDLTAAGHEVEWVGDWPEDPGDDAILARAHAESRVVVTIDKDFGELAVRLGAPHCGIIRLVGLSLRHHAAVILHALSLHGAELASGAIVTAEPGRLRIRLP